MSHCPRHDALIDGIRDHVPEEPGIYIFFGERKEILYIGKAINLRKRMLGHLRSDVFAEEPRHARLVFAISHFDYQTTGSELLALLREDELIKQHQPRFNVRQNEFLAYKYLELTADDYPRLRMVDHPIDSDARRVFGPFRDRYLVDRILQLIHQHIGLRSCANLDQGDGCLEFDLEHCVGPCKRSVTIDDYRSVVTRTTAFLDGNASELASQLQLAMSLAAESLEFEKAQRLKAHLAFCHRFAERQRFLNAFKAQRLTVVERGEPDLTYLFLRGRMIAHGTAADLAKCRPSGIGSDGSAEDPRFLLDRASVVHTWLRRNTDRSRYYFEDPDTRDL